MRTRLPEGSRNAQLCGAPGLGDGLLEDLGARRPDLFEFRVEVVRSEDRRLERSLGDQGQKAIALGLRAPAVGLEQDDVDILAGCANGDPTEPLGRDVVADLEVERVAVEAECGIGVVDGDEGGGEVDCHATTVWVPTRSLLLRSCSGPQPLESIRGRCARRPRRHHAHAGGDHLVVAVVERSVLRGGHADDLVEAGAERAQRRAAHGHARVGDRRPRAQEGLGSLDAPCHEVGVGRLAVGRSELAREVGRRHQGRAGDGRHVERLSVIPVDEIPRPTQVHEVGHLLRRHADDARRATGVRDHWPAAKTALRPARTDRWARPRRER